MDYFYPRSPCGERLENTLRQVVNRCISIHALLAESDHPRTSSRPRNTEFLSTLSLRRATISPNGGQYSVYSISIHALLAESDAHLVHTRNFGHFISIHALLAESDPKRVHNSASKNISIHALLAESDRAAMPVSVPPFRFLSTLSLRRATKDTTARQQIADISIHALLAESDTADIASFAGLCNFYPRSPCGERLSLVG